MDGWMDNDNDSDKDKDLNQCGKPDEAEVVGWWVRGASQQALLSGHPGSLLVVMLPIQHSTKTYKSVIVRIQYLRLNALTSDSLEDTPE